MTERDAPIKFAVCVSNAEYPASLELHKIYRVLPDEEAELDSDLRVVDESGEDYLYPADYFVLMDAATSVHYLMRNLMSKPPRLAAIRIEIEGVPEEQVFEALDAVQAAHHIGHGTADPYKNFRWNIKRVPGRSSNRYKASETLPAPNQMSD